MLRLFNSSAEVLDSNKDLVEMSCVIVPCRLMGVVIERVIMTTWCSQPFKEVFGFLL